MPTPFSDHKNIVTRAINTYIQTNENANYHLYTGLLSKFVKSARLSRYDLLLKVGQRLHYKGDSSVHFCKNRKKKLKRYELGCWSIMKPGRLLLTFYQSAGKWVRGLKNAYLLFAFYMTSKAIGINFSFFFSWHLSFDVS